MAKWSRGAFLDDIQALHLDALDAIEAAYRLVRQQAITSMDVAALRELDYAMKRIRKAWSLVMDEHPNGRSHE